MKSKRLVLVFAMLALACASKEAPDDNGGRSGPLQSRLKAQTTTTMTATETATSTRTSTATGTATQTVTVTQTVTATASTTGSGTTTVTQTVTATATTTAIQTGAVTATGTQTVTFTGTRTGTAPGIYQQIYTFTGTITATSTGIVYYASWPHSQGNTATATTNQFASGTGLTTVTRTVTSPLNGTETKTQSATVTGSGTKTGTTTVTVTATVTTGTTNAGTGTRTVTATGTATGTATQTWTATWTTQVTQTVTNTNTSTVTNTNTVSNTATLTNTNTLTQTTTETSSTTGTSTTTNTSTTTSTNTTTRTTTNTNTDTVTTTVTLTMTATDTSVDAGTGDGGGGSCLQNWRNTTCGEWCLRETQEDRRHCTLFLDCYLQNGVGPTDNPDGTCGVNHFNYGMAPKTIADQVYLCLACPGTSPVTSCSGLPDTTPCTDGNACTAGDMCIGGACVPGGPRSCDDGNVCTDDSCNPATGCVHVNNTASCDDGNACTTSDTCSGGSCMGGPAPSCDDGNGCTDDSCNPATGCVHSNNTAACDDGNACTQTDLCVAGVCAGTNPVGCPASDQCHVGVCDPATGNCSDQPVNGGACADGNGCTTADTCENGVCVGSGSGFVGPGEQCAPATPTTPGPFGNFHCLLEEVPSTGKNILHLGAGTLSGSWILRGTMDFSLTAAGAKLTKLSATGQHDRLSLQNGIVLALDRNATSSGSVDTTNGNVQVNLPVLAFGPSGDRVNTSLYFVGQIGDRVLQGSAAASGAVTAQIQLFCREQFMNTVASVTFQLDQAGNFVAQGPIEIFGGTPTMPGPRSIPGSEDLVVEFVSVTGEILDQYGIGQPWDPTATSDVTVRPPLSNRLGAVRLRTAAGNALATADLAAAIDSFCGGTGSQYCDYRADAPVREVVYAADMRPRILDLEPPTSDNPNQIRPLPASSRLDGETKTIASGARDIQPSVAMDGSGNAVVVWRRLLDDGPSSRYDIMAQGISNDGTIAFGPVKVNDPYCSSSPGEEYATSGPLTFRPRVARSPDGTFVVAWGGYYPLLLGAGGEEPRFVHVGNICARVLNADGTFFTDHPISVVTDSDWWFNVETGPIDWWTTYFDVAIAEWPPPTPRHSFIVTWSGRYPESSPRHDNDWYKIWARSFGADGDPLSGPEPVLVGLNNSAHLLYPTVAASGDGFGVIAWLEASGEVKSSASGLAGHAKMQRVYPNMITKVGGPIDGPSIAGIPDATLLWNREDFGLVGRTGTDTIWSTRYDFGSGNAIGTALTLNARHGGKQRRPVLANGADGEIMAAWMDDVGIGSGTGSVIAAQLFDGSSLPEDIDFTVSTQAAIDVPKIPDLADASSVAAECQAASEPRDYCVHGDDPYLFQDGFGFDVATSGHHFAVVWQSTDGILLQRVRGGRPACPDGTDCGRAIPLRITGAAKDKIDVILSPGEVIREDTGRVDPSFTEPYTSASEFARVAVDLIVNGYLASNIFPDYSSEFNFYYDMTQGIRHMKYSGGQCKGLRGDDSTEGAKPEYIGYNGESSFADAGGVIFRQMDWQSGGCLQYSTAGGLSIMRKPLSEDVRTGPIRPFWVQNTTNYGTFLHESGHALFGLRDEYCSVSAWEDTAFHSNTFGTPSLDGQERCTTRSRSPGTCRRIPECSYWVADPDTDLMFGGNRTQFGLDCQRRAQCVIEDIQAVECP
jgi:hypothetical protein